MPSGVYEKTRGARKGKYNCGRNNPNWRHGGTHTRLYLVWNSMRDRCFNENNPDYSRYGGRDIYVCPEWIFDFAAFRDWAIKSGYKEGLSIDRINNDEDYSPINCQWIPITENVNKVKRLHNELGQFVVG